MDGIEFAFVLSFFGAMLSNHFSAGAAPITVQVGLEPPLTLDRSTKK